MLMHESDKSIDIIVRVRI